MERLRAHYLENATTLSITSEMFDAVLACKPTSVVDINIRLVALQSFMTLADAQSLSSANKRIANILRKAPEGLSGAVETQRLLEPAERQLFDQVVSMERAVNPLFVRRDYISALSQLATLRPDVDRFFDSVMVMAEDNEIRTNRLSLLVRLRALFLQVADLSRLPG
jgi:glycyl-tRNA synthetase beta chain